jgi:hypothetical protein
MFSREQYLSGECANADYYAQFVTEAARQIVLNTIGRERILKSTNKYLNDIPLHLWDRLSFPVKGLKEAGDYLTLAGKVCIAKEIARQYKESQSNNAA